MACNVCYEGCSKEDRKDEDHFGVLIREGSVNLKTGSPDRERRWTLFNPILAMVMRRF